MANEGNGREEEEEKEGGLSGRGGIGDKAGGPSPTAPGCWVELDFGEVVAVAGLEIQPPPKHRKGERRTEEKEKPYQLRHLFEDVYL